jgi:phage/plasmid primase-like uncharacterized protein
MGAAATTAAAAVAKFMLRLLLRRPAAESMVRSRGVPTVAAITEAVTAAVMVAITATSLRVKKLAATELVAVYRNDMK